MVAYIYIARKGALTARNEENCKRKAIAAPLTNMLLKFLSHSAHTVLTMHACTVFHKKMKKKTIRPGALFGPELEQKERGLDSTQRKFR